MLNHTIKRVEFFPEHVLVRYPGNPFTGVISITEPHRIARIAEDAWGALLRLAFHDIDNPIQGYTPFNSKMAQRVFRWLTTYETKLEAIYVHCSLGISRSAAVALFLSERYKLPIDSYKYNRHNSFVYKTLHNLWTETISSGVDIVR